MRIVRTIMIDCYFIKNSLFIVGYSFAMMHCTPGGGAQYEKRKDNNNNSLVYRNTAASLMV